jgi:hypothetical protein
MDIKLHHCSKNFNICDKHNNKSIYSATINLLNNNPVIVIFPLINNYLYVINVTIIKINKIKNCVHYYETTKIIKNNEIDTIRLVACDGCNYDDYEYKLENNVFKVLFSTVCNFKYIFKYEVETFKL